jgi:hypothetical protein
VKVEASPDVLVGRLARNGRAKAARSTSAILLVVVVVFRHSRVEVVALVALADVVAYQVCAGAEGNGHDDGPIRQRAPGRALRRWPAVPGGGYAP